MMKVCHFKQLLEKIDYLTNENKLLKDKIENQRKELNKAYNDGLKKGFEDAIKEINKYD
jgi:TATA-binding protein-associated factor Taf7